MRGGATAGASLLWTIVIATIPSGRLAVAPLTCASEQHDEAVAAAEDEFTTLLQLSSDLTNRKAQDYRDLASASGIVQIPSAGTLLEMAALVLMPGRAAVARLPEPPHGGLKLLSAVLLVALMLVSVVVITQSDCLGRPSHIDRRGPPQQVDEQHRVGCCQAFCEWQRRLLLQFRDCCSGRRYRDVPESEIMTLSEQTEQRILRRSYMLLFVGALMMFIAFFMVACLAFLGFAFEVQLNFMGKPFPSGHNYFPQHVAEFVQDSTTATSKMFFAFCFLSSICLLTSWYPWRLRNVDVGDEAISCLRLPWLTLRHFVPATTLIFMACVPTSRLAVAGHKGAWGQVTVYANLMAFLVFMLSYILSEMHALIFSRLSQEAGIAVGRREWKVRMALIAACSICFVLFEVCGLVDGLLPSVGVCCSDVWVVPNSTTVQELLKQNAGHVLISEAAMLDDTRLLYDTSKGLPLIFKMIEFSLQVSACLCLALNQLAIWYYCVERRNDGSPESVESPISEYRETLQKDLPRPGGHPQLPMFSKLPHLPARQGHPGPPGSSAALSRGPPGSSEAVSRQDSQGSSSIRAPRQSWGEVVQDAFTVTPPSSSMLTAQTQWHTNVPGTTPILPSNVVHHQPAVPRLPD